MSNQSWWQKRIEKQNVEFDYLLNRAKASVALLQPNEILYHSRQLVKK